MNRLRSPVFRTLAFLAALLLSERLAQWLHSFVPEQGEQNGTVVLTAAATSPTAIELKWQKRLEDLSFNALPNIRAAAEKWLATVSAVTGVFGIFALVKGRSDITKLAEGWEIAVAILLGVASLFAIRAILLAALAAEGSATRAVLTTTGLRAEFNRAAAVAAAQLRSSRILIVLATLLVGIAIALVWFGRVEPADPQMRDVTLANGKTLCGSLAINSSGTLKLTAPDGKTLREAIASREISQIEDTDICTS